jgi:hypothetical protein
VQNLTVRICGPLAEDGAEEREIHLSSADPAADLRLFMAPSTPLRAGRRSSCAGSGRSVASTATAAQGVIQSKISPWAVRIEQPQSLPQLSRYPENAEALWEAGPGAEARGRMREQDDILMPVDDISASVVDGHIRLVATGIHTGDATGNLPFIHGLLGTSVPAPAATISLTACLRGLSCSQPAGASTGTGTGAGAAGAAGLTEAEFCAHLRDSLLLLLPSRF